MANSGRVTGDYTVELKINNLVEATKQVTLAPNTEMTVAFTVTRDVIGSYQVEVNGLVGQFSMGVLPSASLPPSAQGAIDWPLITWDIVGLGTVGYLIYFLVRRRTH